MPKTNKKNIKLAWSVLCSGITVDRQSNNVSLYNIIEEINVSRNELVEIKNNGAKNFGVPVFFNLFSVWHRIGNVGPMTAEIKIEVVDPLGSKRKVTNRQIKFTKESERFRLGIAWKGIKVSTSGVYTFVVSKKIKGEKSFSKAGEAYLKINIIEEVKLPKSKSLK